MSEGKRVKEENPEAGESVKLFRCRYCKKCIQGIQNFVDHKRKNHPDETQQLKQSQSRSSNTSSDNPLPLLTVEPNLEPESTLRNVDVTKPVNESCDGTPNREAEEIYSVPSLLERYAEPLHSSRSLASVQEDYSDAHDQNYRTEADVKPDIECIQTPVNPETECPHAVALVKTELLEEEFVHGNQDYDYAEAFETTDPPEVSHDLQSYLTEPSCTSVDVLDPEILGLSHSVFEQSEDLNHSKPCSLSPDEALEADFFLSLKRQRSREGSNSETSSKFLRSSYVVSEDWDAPVICSAFSIQPDKVCDEIQVSVTSEENDKSLIASDCIDSTCVEPLMPQPSHSEPVKSENAENSRISEDNNIAIGNEGLSICSGSEPSIIPEKKMKISPDSPQLPQKSPYDSLLSEYLFYRNQNKSNCDSGPPSPQSDDLVIDESGISDDFEDPSSPANNNTSTAAQWNSTPITSQLQPGPLQQTLPATHLQVSENYFCHHCDQRFEDSSQKSLHERTCHNIVTSLLQSNQLQYSSVPTLPTSTPVIFKLSLLQATSIPSATRTEHQLLAQSCSQSPPTKWSPIPILQSPEDSLTSNHGSATLKDQPKLPESSQQIQKVQSPQPQFTKHYMSQQQQIPGGQSAMVPTTTQPSTRPNLTFSTVHHRPQGTLFRNLVCTYCGKSFSMPINLTNHLRLHEGLSAFDCDMCGQRETCQENLFKHRSYAHQKYGIHNRNTRVSYPGANIHPPLLYCNACSLAFTTKQELEMHVRIHRVKQHRCKYCPETFAMLESLDSHHRAHEQKVINCEICNSGIIQNMWQRHRETCERMLETTIKKSTRNVTINIDKAVIIHQYSGRPEFNAAVTAAACMSIQNKGWI